jgi:CubicO group peptidase (beta-lactamase class C family)
MRLSLGRLQYALASACMLLSLQGGRALADQWQSVAPVDAGFAPNVGELLDQAVEGGDVANLHAVVVARHGRLVLERYYEGSDERWGEPLGTVTFGPDVMHDVRSVSKSILGLLYGIALDDGHVPSLDEALVDQFPAYDDLRGDPECRRMTVAHALTMTLGTEWDESLPPVGRSWGGAAGSNAHSRTAFRPWMGSSRAINGGSAGGASTAGGGSPASATAASGSSSFPTSTSWSRSWPATTTSRTPGRSR